jgi:hypothetical protein
VSRRITLLAALLAVAALFGAAPAMATSVMNPTVSLSTTAGGVQHAEYVVNFTASGPVGSGGSITIAAPAGTVLPTVADIHNDTTNASFSRFGTPANAGATLTISLCCSDTINPGDSITVTLDDVKNAATGGPYVVNVSTSADTTPAATPGYTLTAPEPISALSAISLSSTAVAAQHVSYSFSFNASASTGRLLTSGTIKISAPPGTVLPGEAVIHNVTSGQTVSRFGTLTNGNATMELGLCCSDLIDPGDTVEVTLHDVTNPNSGGAKTLDVSTSSNPSPVTSQSYTITPTEPVTNVSGVTLSSAAGGVQHVSYSFSFNASTGNGKLVSPGTIKIAAPPGTVLPTFAEIHNETTGQTFSRSGTRTSFNATLEVEICCSDVINPGDRVTVTLVDVTNPAAASNLALSVSTSSNPTPVASLTYSLTAPEQITGLSAVSLSSPAGGIKHVRYSFSFNASGSTGRLVAPGTIKIAAPAGTVLPTFASIRDDTSGQTFNRSGTRTNSNATLELEICCSDIINPGDAVTVTLDDVTSPSTGGPYSLDVSTSSNPTPVTTPPYSLSAPQQVSGVTAVTTSTDSGGEVSDSLSFTASSTGRLVPPGTITIAGPAGTVMPTFAEIHDETTGQTFSRSGARSNSNATLEVELCCSDLINVSDKVTVTLPGVVNPAGGAGPLDISTSSDPSAVTTPSPGTTPPPDNTPPSNITPPPTDATPAGNTTPPGDEPPVVPPPIVGKTAAAAPLKGTVLIKVPGGQFVELTEATGIPVGSILDTTKGQVSLTFATNAQGGTQRGSFSEGQFQVQQTKKNPLTTLSMVGGGLNACKTKLPKGGAKKPELATAARKRRRTLFSSVKGRFRTRGRNSSATVRGTKWRMTDTCTGTKTTVTQGTVVVRDLRLRRNVIVKAGHSYLARAPLRKKRKKRR